MARGKDDSLGPPELLLGPLNPYLMPLTFRSYIKRVSMIITVSKILWIKKSFFFLIERPQDPWTPSWTPKYPQSAPFSHIIISFWIKHTEIYTISDGLKHQWYDNKTPIWQCNTGVPTSNSEVVRQPWPRNPHKMGIILYQVPGEQRITRNY